MIRASKTPALTLLPFVLLGLFVILGLVPAAHAQITPATLTVGAASGSAGTNVVIPISFTPSPSIGASGMNWDLTLPSGWTFVSAVEGPAATAAQKTISSNLAIGRFLVFGFNQTVIGQGVIANITVSIPAGAAGGSNGVPISLITVTDPAGSMAIPTNGVNGSITVIDTIAPNPPTSLQGQ